MNKVMRIFILIAIAVTFSLPAFAQETTGTTAAAGAQTDEKAKADLYEKWRSNRKTNQQVAYDAGKEYLQKYGKDEDEYVKAVRKFVTTYESAKVEFDYQQALKGKNWAEAYRLGRQVLSANPNRTDVKLNLGWAGYLASVDNNNSFNTDAANFAREAAQDIENGRQPMGMDATGKEIVSWAPFGTREDALGGLYFALGSFASKSSRHEEAAQSFYKAAQQNGFTKKEPTTYANLAGAYEVHEYKRYADEYRTMTSTDATAAEKPEAKALLAKLDDVSDRIIDAYARAIANANDPKYAAQKSAWMKKLTALYKFRHNDSEAGLNEFIAGILNRPMPSPTPAATATAPATTSPATGTGNGAGMGNGAGTGTATGAGTQPATTTTTTTTSTTTTTARPAPATTATRPATTNNAAKPTTNNATKPATGTAARPTGTTSTAKPKP